MKSKLLKIKRQVFAGTFIRISKRNVRLLMTAFKNRSERLARKASPGMIGNLEDWTESLNDWTEFCARCNMPEVVDHICDCALNGFPLYLERSREQKYRPLRVKFALHRANEYYLKSGVEFDGERFVGMLLEW